MKKIFLVLLAVAIVSCESVQATAQAGRKIKTQSCQLTTAPALRGFRLGDEKATIVAQLGGWDHIDYYGRYEGPNGWSSFSFQPVVARPDMAPFYPQFARRDPRWDGMSSARFDFLDNRLTMFGISYAQSVDSNDAKEFLVTVSHSLNVPFEAWRSSPIIAGQQGASMQCYGFSISASLGHSPSIMISQDGVTEELVRRAQAAAEAKRRTFRP